MIAAGDEARLSDCPERLMASTGFADRWKVIMAPHPNGTPSRYKTVSGTPFQSILFGRAEELVSPATAEEPACFGDLHLDQILSSVTAGREEYDLAPFFYRPLRSIESVRFRHHIVRDLEQERVLASVRSFAAEMRRMREHLALARKLYYRLQKQRLFLSAAAVYCRAITAFAAELLAVDLESNGLSSLRAYLVDYTQSNAFVSLADDTKLALDALAAVTYAIHIRGSRVRVSAFGGEPDMSDEVQRAFAKFQQGAVTDYRAKFREPAEMNHIEARILELVAKLFPEPFSRLADFSAQHMDFVDRTIGRFDREVQFYVAYLEYIAPLKSKGLEFAYPRVSAGSKELTSTGSFDLALATKLVAEGGSVVCNDFFLTGPERILVVSGPNNGGKTTFARTYGQLHYLASLGLPVPGRDVALFLPDEIFTHFEREEDIETLRGKFEDELFRIHEILDEATSDSILIMNESFGSTTLRDAVLVGTEVVGQIIVLDALCVFVTFVDELSVLGESTVSMMSTVVTEDPAIRTFKVVRKPADGLAYAAALAEKYGLTYDSLRARIQR
jgi:DNA mismatch repair protein MutS